MDIKLDEQTMQSMVAKAMFDGMTQERRDQLLTTAIQNLLSKPTSQYDQTPAIQRMFNDQVETAARHIAYDRLANDESFKSRVEAMFADAAKKVFDDTERRNKIVDALAEAMRKSITGDRY